MLNGATPDFTGRSVKLFDTEGTGLEDPQILESCWIELESHAHIGGFFHMEAPDYENWRGQLVKHSTTKPTSLGALATHHILPSDIPEDAEPFDIDKHLGGDNIVLVGHNIDFDWAAANATDPKGLRLLGVPRICTLAMARRVWPDLDSHKLTALLYHINGRTPEVRQLLLAAHSAEADVMFNLKLLLEICRLRPEIKSWAALWAFSEDARIPRRWTFGKYGPQGNQNPGPVGALIADTASDRGYFKWVRGNCTDKPDWHYLSQALDLAERGQLTP